MHILVVDDERSIRDGLKRTIQSAFGNVAVSTAQSAAEALEILRDEPIQVVFLDVMMPGTNGLELLAEARDRHNGIKWIVVSAYSEFAYAQEALRLGAKDYILKPLGKEKVIQTVSELLKEWQTEKSGATNAGLLKQNLHYLREAVFRRWIQGLDIGHFNLRSIREEHDSFYLLAVKLERHAGLKLGNFIVENIMAELIEQRGRGFIVNVDGDFLAGVITLSEEVEHEHFKRDAIQYLERCLEGSHQFYMSQLLHDFYAIPDEISKLNAGRHGMGTNGEPSQDSGKNEDAIDIAIQYIKSNFQDNLTLEIVASVVYLNPVYFSKLFKSRTGKGYKEYLTGLRMERAAELLSDPELSVTRIAEMVGYPDVRHFTQVFHKHYDCTPTHFRTDHAHV